MAFVPLMHQTEKDKWDNKIKQARVRRHDQDRDTWKRGQRVVAQRRARIIALAKERPYEYLANLITIVSSRGAAGQPDLEGAYVDFDPDEVDTYNTPEGRWWTDKFLEAVANMPTTYAVSAARRYLKGNGKQAKLTTPGVGLMSVNNGWKGKEVDLVTAMFFDTTFGAPCYDPEYIGEHSDADLDEDQREELWESGAAYSAMRCEKDKDFIQELRDILATMEMKAPNITPPKPKKPRKIKVFKVGDKVTKRNARDLPVGAVIGFVGKPNKWRCGDADVPKSHKNYWGEHICHRCRRNPAFKHDDTPRLGFGKKYMWTSTFNERDKLVVSLKPLKKDNCYFYVNGLDDVNGMIVITLPQGYNE